MFNDDALFDDRLGAALDCAAQWLKNPRQTYTDLGDRCGDNAHFMLQ